MDTPPRQLRSGKRKGVTPPSPEQDPNTPRPAAAGVVGRGPSNAESSTTPRRLRHRANINIFPDITGNERVELAFFASSPPPEIHLATPRTTEAPVYHLSSQTPDLPKPSAEPLLLRDLLYIPPPVAPPIYDKYKLTSTRGMTVDDISLPEDLQLKTIVPVHSLLEPIIKFAEGQIEGKYIHPDQWEELSWLSRIHPAVTSSSLPSIIHSEKDSEAWCLNVLFRPSLTVACAVFEDSFVVPEKNPEFDDFPNLTSAHGAGKGASIPDVMLWRLHRVLCAIFEVKTHAAFLDASNEVLWKRTFGSILYSWPDMPVGYTIKFNWPEEDDKVSAKSDRMIAQVWLQMVKNNTNIAALTNYSSIVFFVRKDQTLYMSGEYLRNMRMPLAIYAFMAYALGKIPKSLLRLPTVTDDWWEVKNHKVETTNTPGVDVGTAPEALRTVIGRLPPSQRPKRESGFEWPY